MAWNYPDTSLASLGKWQTDLQEDLVSNNVHLIKKKNGKKKKYVGIKQALCTDGCGEIMFKILNTIADQAQHCKDFQREYRKKCADSR